MRNIVLNWIQLINLLVKRISFQPEDRTNIYLSSKTINNLSVHITHDNMAYIYIYIYIHICISHIYISH